jgi:hypothetical protein
MRRLQRWSLPFLRVLLWVVAIFYLALEAREVTTLRQLTQITIFAVLFVVANFQINLARSFEPGHPEVRPLHDAALAMFLASLFSLLDGAMDYLFASTSRGMASALLPAFYLLNWTVNLFCVALALGSMEGLLASVRRQIDRP